MKKKLLQALLAVVMIFALAQPVFAAETIPSLQTCPPGYNLMVMDEHMDHNDFHIGLKVDLNGDGMICMKVLANGLHVHMDNVVP